MDTDYYLGFDDAKDRALLEVLDRNDGAAKSKLKRTLWTAASTLALAALGIGAYVAAPSRHQHVAASSSAVLLSDQYGAYGAYDGDTSTPAPTAPTDVYGNDLPEGRAVKCGFLRLETFRYTNGERRWYPTATIALSWDPTYLFKFSVVDCSQIPRGSDMTLKLPSPSSYPDGQAIKCDPSQAEVFRLMGGKRCWYPSSTIASSWDSLWSKFVVVDCSSLPRGDDMQFNPKALTDGQSIKCGASASTFFRIAGGKRCAYTSNAIASSWDANWSAALTVDCSLLPMGPDMQLNPKSLPEGHAVKCSASASEIFRLVAGKRCQYPTSDIALSWDKNYNAALVIDCTVVAQGPNMCYNHQALPEGQAVKCSATATDVFRLAGGKRCRYPTTQIALSWDKNYGAALVVDCATVTQGPDVCYNHQTLPEGQAIKCSATASEIFRLAGGKRCRYPTREVALSWDKSYNAALVVDCTVVTQGPDMCTNPSTLPDGKTVKCEGKSDLYRIENKMKRLYTTITIATSWDPDCTKNAIVVDCSALPSGNDMCTNPTGLPVGQPIKCSASATEVYRLVAGGKYRWYPSPAVATSWDANWSSNVVVVDCSVLIKGDDLCTNPTGLPDGKTIKCEGKPDLFRIENKKKRLYPSLSIATSWDADCAKTAIIVDCSVFPSGDDMCFNQPHIVNGQAIICLGQDATKVFRYCDELVRWYPTTSIADSWDPDWKSAVLADCSKFKAGPDMAAHTSAAAASAY